MYRGTELPGNGNLFDFRGGMATARPKTKLDINQAQLLRNVFITPGGGLKKRNGNTVFNSTAMNSGANVQGLHYYKQEDGDDFLLAICGNKIFKSDSLDGTMDDVTGGVTITGGQNNIWDMLTFENTVIAIGGAPDAPIKWTGTGNAAALGGSPPSGNFGFQVNNRIFIGNTSANPSRIQWSVLADAEDWSGTGSGSQDVWTGDNDTLVGAAILNTDLVLLFKENSIHQMLVRNSPFPVFPLFKEVGAVGKNAIVVIDGLVYFITPRGRMVITDGVQLVDEKQLPRLQDIDDQWDGANASRLTYVQGVRYHGKEFDHLIWLISDGSSTTNNRAFVWDLRNKCWLNHTTGHNGNVMALTQTGTLYMGAYDGKIYKMYVDTVFSDASESNTNIDGFWRWGWQTRGRLQTSVKPFRLNTVMEGQTSGNLSISYGFDFETEQKTKTVSMQTAGGVWNQAIWDTDQWGGQTDLMKHIFVLGRGNAFNVSYQNNIVDENFNIHGFTISGKDSAQKVFDAK